MSRNGAGTGRKDSVRLLWIEAFLAASKRGSFAAAKDDVQLNERNVSKSVKQLEEWLGFELFERPAPGTKLPLKLTTKGEMFRLKSEEFVMFIYNMRASTIFDIVNMFFAKSDVGLEIKFISKIVDGKKVINLEHVRKTNDLDDSNLLT